uniref:FERM domain-containing protein n=1 Tax=Ascaris lumbricoides TaxID=6252 RepID=A0A0M3HKE1_ASCLU
MKYFFFQRVYFQFFSFSSFFDFLLDKMSVSYFY